MSTEEKIQRCKDAFREYRISLEFTAGCGERGQCYIDEAYEKLKAAHQDLSPELRAANPLPAKQRATDDGSFGLASGMAALAGRRY